MKKKVLLIGPILTQTGYGEHARFVYRALKSEKDIFDIYIHPINWGTSGWLWEDNEERHEIDDLIAKTMLWRQQGGQFDMTLMVTIPSEWPGYRSAPVNIGITAGIESSKVSPQWLEAANQAADKIIFTSNFSKQMFENTSYSTQHPQTGAPMRLEFTAKSEVVNYPVKKYDEVDLDLNIDTKFNFLCIAQWGPRKNIENTIRWFIEEFIDQDVGLVLKANKRGGSTIDKIQTRNNIEQILREYPEKRCKVYLLHGYMNNDELHSLYVHPKINGLVSLTHGEGYGLPLFEAAYCGMPIVTHDWGGQTDFLNAEVKNKKGVVKKKGLYAKVEYDLKQIQPEAVWDGVLQADSMWAYPKEGKTKMKLRDFYKNYGRYKSQAKKLQKQILKNFDEEKIYKKMVDAIYEKETFELEEWLQELENDVEEIE